MRDPSVQVEHVPDPDGGAVTARLLDATIDGMSIHRALDPRPSDDTLVVEAVRRIAVGR